MKKICISIFILILFTGAVFGQHNSEDRPSQDIRSLIGQYSLARERQDTLLLKSILTEDIDQLVSTGEWRYGIASAVQGMVQSSKSNEGERTIVVERIKFLTKDAAVADARYEIKSPTGDIRKMWSTFLAVRNHYKWKIAGIRNMAPKENR